jgi:outer membrane biosynthesis protein TonB
MQMTLSITAEPSEMMTVLRVLQTAGVAEQVVVTSAAPPPPATPEELPAFVVQPPKLRGRPPKEKEPPPKAAKSKPEPEAKLKVVPKEKPEPEPEPPKELTSMDVRKALTEFLAANSEAAATELLKTHGDGCTRLSQLKPELYAAVYAAATTPPAKDFNDSIPF